jgi:hypothetical protein
MPGFKIVANLLSPDGYEATLEGVTAAQTDAAKEVDIDITAGQSKVLNWSIKRVAGSGGKDVTATSSAAPWLDALSQSSIPDASFAGGAVVSGIWTINVPTDATPATIPALTLAFNEA